MYENCWTDIRITYRNEDKSTNTCGQNRRKPTCNHVLGKRYKRTQSDLYCTIGNIFWSNIRLPVGVRKLNKSKHKARCTTHLALFTVALCFPWSDNHLSFRGALTRCPLKKTRPTQKNGYRSYAVKRSRAVLTCRTKRDTCACGNHVYAVRILFQRCRNLRCFFVIVLQSMTKTQQSLCAFREAATISHFVARLPDAH